MPSRRIRHPTTISTERAWRCSASNIFVRCLHVRQPRRRAQIPRIPMMLRTLLTEVWPTLAKELKIQYLTNTSSMSSSTNLCNKGQMMPTIWTRRIKFQSNLRFTALQLLGLYLFSFSHSDLLPFIPLLSHSDSPFPTFQSFRLPLFLNCTF